MHQPNTPSLVARLQALRARIAAAFTTEPKGRRSVLNLETMEDRSVPATISGTAWYDSNGNGTQDSNEGVAAGIGVTLTPNGGSPVSATTDSNGYYAFSGLGSGSYGVSFTAASGFAVTTPSGGHTFVNLSTTDVAVGAGLSVSSGSGSGSGSSSVWVSKLTNAIEGGSGAFHFTRTGNTSSALTVNFSVSGTATSGTDYTALGTTVTFAAGSATADKTVAALADNVVEGNETVIATVTSGSGYTVGSPSAATVTITDDPPVISVANLSGAMENVSNGSFRFTRTGGKISDALTVAYTVGGTAGAGFDYTALSGSVTFAASSSTTDVTVAVLNDSTTEFTESVVAYLQSGTNYTLGTDEATVNIADDETPLVDIQKNTDAIEGGSDGEFWFTRLGNLSSSLTVSYAVSGTATSGTDFTSIGTSVTFAAGASLAIVTVHASSDGTSDPNETVTVTIQTGSGYQRDLVYAETLTIIDSSTPFVTVEKIDNGVEGAGNGKFRFTRTGSTASALTIYYTVDGDATSGTDYTALAGSVTIAASATTADVTVTVTNDTTDEPLENVAVSITANSNYAIGDSGSAVVMLEDNDLPEVTVTKIVDAAETGGFGIFRFSRTLGELDTALTVSYTVGGTATAGTDYPSLSGTVTFAANESTVDVVITPNTDGSTEGTETVSVTLSSGAAYTIGAAFSATLNIREEAAGTISGKFWSDTDGDGILDGGETGLGYRSVFLMLSGKVITEAMTDTSGDYSFSSVTAGTYDVLFDVPGDFTPTASTGGVKSVTLTAGATASGVNCGGQPPASFTPTGKRDGIDWSTFDASTPKENKFMGITGHDYKVKTVAGNVITVFVAHPLAVQPAGSSAEDIKYNCHGFSMNLQHVTLANGSSVSFSLIDPMSTITLLADAYKDVSPKDAKAALGAKQKVIVVFWGKNPDWLPQTTRPDNRTKIQQEVIAAYHSEVVTSLELAGTSANLDKSIGNTKNGWEALESGKPIRETFDRYNKDFKKQFPMNDLFTAFYIIK